MRVREREGGNQFRERERGGAISLEREGGGRNQFLTVQSNIPVFAIYDRIEYK